MTAHDWPIHFKYESDLHAWLEAQAQAHGYQFLLAHADDGVIWGRFDPGPGGERRVLVTSGEAFDLVQVALRPATLQQARLFGEAGELFIWRDGQGFSGRPRDDLLEFYDETYRLWGQAEQQTNRGFSLMVEGKEGLRHAVPKEIAAGGRAVLVTRHYIDDIDGQAAVVDSRLVCVKQADKEG